MNRLQQISLTMTHAQFDSISCRFKVNTLGHSQSSLKAIRIESRGCLGGLILGALLLASSSLASPSVELFDGPDGLTCSYFNLGARVAWKNKAGDWIDANQQAQGTTPFSKVTLSDRDPESAPESNVTAAVNEATKRSSPILGLALVAIPGGGTGIAAFHSNETRNPLWRPSLVLEYASGDKDLLWPKADTYTDCTTNASLGNKELLLAGDGRNAFIEFDLSTMRKSSTLSKATLKLTRTSSRFGGLTLGVFAIARPVVAANEKGLAGLAASYPKDNGIERDPNVFMATGFNTPRWLEAWTTTNTYGAAPTFDTVDNDVQRQFAPLVGRALRVRIPRGNNLGLDMRYEFSRRHSAEPEEAFFRYYLRLADDWLPTVDGGKMPGFSGTYGVAAWGDRPADPLKGWSMRGSFNRLPDRANPLRAYVTMGTYATHADPNGLLGEVWPWTTGMNGLLERNRWYCVEQFIKLNSPGNSDGVLRVWIDGQPALERTNMRVRDTRGLKIEAVWMNVYHGGRDPAPQDMHLYIDNVVIARKYIGPIAQP